MDLSQSPDYEQFRVQVRDFLEDKLTDDLREAGRLATSVFPNMERAIAWQKILNEKGWAAPGWPVEFGGTDWDAVQSNIYAQECLAANAPPGIAQGIKMCGPCLIGCGTKEQQDYYLPRLLSAEHIWCQGYSEPGSGSDLASLSTSAVSDGDDYVINGAKIWTSNAHDATHMFCLVRTSTEGRPQQGITFLLLEMDIPGITVEPIYNLNGVREQNTVYFDNVRVPKTNRVGEENQGWTVAKYLLEFERGGSSMVPKLRRNIEIIRSFAKNEVTADGECLLEDRVFSRKLAELEIETTALEFTEHRIHQALSNGEAPGVLASMTNIVQSKLAQAVEKLTIETIGLHSLPVQSEALTPGSNVEPIGPEQALTAMPRFLDGRAATIYGGSDEVQHGIIAKSVLGL